MPFEWDHSLTTGVPRIDAQHKELINRLNHFLAALSEGKGRDEIGQTLEFLDQYTQYHFHDEEQCMDDYQCPVAAINRTAHERFIKRLAEIKEQFQIKGTSSALAMTIGRELADWYVNHIKNVDRQLYTCVKKQQD